MINPLFSNDHDEKEEKRHSDSYLVGKRRSGRIEPIHTDVRPEPTHHKPVAKPAPEPKAIVHHHESPEQTHAGAYKPKSELKPEAVMLPPEKQLANLVQPDTKKQASAQVTNKTAEDEDPAVALIRRKLDALYENEPKAKEEIAEIADTTPKHRSKHQQYMQELSTSGKSLAEIQTAWHQYYVALPDNEKHEVWQEFYQANERRPSQYSQFVEQHAETKPTASSEHAVHEIEPVPEHAKKLEPEAKVAVFEKTPPALPHRDRRSASTIKRQILSKVSSEKQAKAKQHLKSLIFGISTGVIVLVIFLFSFFNEVVIAPFIQPSRKASATPIILSSDGVAPTDKNEVIIPKINVQIPLDFSVKTTDEGAIENALDSGVVHYPTTVTPGQRGNTAFFGHSSNNIFNPGKYKFAFVLLHALENGDIFYITYNGKVYSYKVYQKQIVNPSNVSVLNPVADKTATATLITCDPPGTSINRLVVWGEQVSPDPAGNSVGSPTTSTTTNPNALPSNGPTLWGRFIKWLTN